MTSRALPNIPPQGQGADVEDLELGLEGKKRSSRDWLGEDVNDLIGGRNMMDHHFSLKDIVSNEEQV